MKRMALTAAIALLAAPALAGGADDDTLVVNGEIEMTTKADAPDHLEGALDQVISGWHFKNGKN